MDDALRDRITNQIFKFEAIENAGSEDVAARKQTICAANCSRYCMTALHRERSYKSAKLDRRYLPKMR